MKENNVILDKTFNFGLRVIKLHLYLKNVKVDCVPSLQILKNGTSAGANAQEAMGGSSKKDFKQKLRISYREARETGYWLQLLKESDLLDQKLADSLISDCEELIRILTAILTQQLTSLP